MASDDKQPGGNLASSSFFIAALVATGAYFIHHEAPLVGSRPAVTEINIQDPGPIHHKSVDARLWQDPFAALGKSLNKSARDDLEKQCEHHPKDAVCVSPLMEAHKSAGDDTMVLGVTMSGAPYAEDSEHRRRTRYAVLAGLERQKFAPTDARHILYFVWKRDKNRNPIIPYERFENQTLGKNIIVLWLKEDIFTETPLKKFAALDDFLFHEANASEVKPAPKRKQPINVATIDINELIYSEREPRSRQIFSIIGPNSSDMLRDMVYELKPCVPTSHQQEILFPDACATHSYHNTNRLTNAKFYSSSANASSKWLLQNIEENISEGDRDPIEVYFSNYANISFERTISPDDRLAGSIVEELDKRLAKNGTDGPNFALISEWDTFYGQTLPKDMTSKLINWFHGSSSVSDNPNNWIYPLTYLRGLDGQLPIDEVTEDDKFSKITHQGDNENNATNFFKTQTDPDKLDRPVGQGQYDYLRRMSEQLQQVDENLRLKKDGRKIDAIGILGSDVFDKLLIFRALRPEFPEALFFTTGFDEAFTMQSELPYTRNLIISSSFGPKLTHSYQGEIPPFRDARQTQAFLATQLAIDETLKGQPASHHALKQAVETTKTDAQGLRKEVAASPRIFEIERSGHVLPLVEFMPEDANAKTGIDRQPLGLDDSEGLYPRYEVKSRYYFILGLSILACIAGAALFNRKVRELAMVEVVIVFTGLVLGAGISAYWDSFASYFTEYGKGEPIVMLEGVSVWPTVLLRVVGIVLAAYFIWLAQKRLRRNLEDVAHRIDIELDENGTCDKHVSGNALKSGFKGYKIISCFAFYFGIRKSENELVIQSEDILDSYVINEEFANRVWRVVIFVGIMILIDMLVIIPLFGTPTFPVRGERAHSFYIFTIWMDAILMQFLIFFVLDATFSCLLFVNRLCLPQTKWLPATIERFGRALHLNGDNTDDWMDLKVVAERTRCIGSLVYYPFVVIALLVVSRSTVFANFAPNLTILITQGISLSLVLACSIMLWWAATTVRDRTKERLMDGIIYAQGHVVGGPDEKEKAQNDNKGLAEQLESLLIRVEQLKDGAFSPISQQPLVRAVLLPMGSFGWASLVEKGIIPGL
jgi:hypothetical protein